MAVPLVAGLVWWLLRRRELCRLPGLYQAIAVIGLAVAWVVTAAMVSILVFAAFSSAK